MSNESGIWLTEGAVLERLRREAGMALDAQVAHAGFIYGERESQVMEGLFREYLTIAEEAGRPIVLGSPTWRAQPHRVAVSGFAGRKLNRDGVEWLRRLVQETRVPVRVAGVLGPYGDCYRAEEALGEEEARDYHHAQMLELAMGGADLLLAATLPALSEAMGIAAAARSLGVPCVLSFVLTPEGELLDGHSLAEAVDALEEMPVSINCTHWRAAKRALEDGGGRVAGRVIGLQANTAACPPWLLEGSPGLVAEAPEEFGKHVADLARSHGLRMAGGCCGSGPAHMRELAKALTGP